MATAKAQTRSHLSARVAQAVRTGLCLQASQSGGPVCSAPRQDTKECGK